jgi:hypothetical protein
MNYVFSSKPDPYSVQVPGIREEQQQQQQQQKNVTSRRFTFISSKLKKLLLSRQKAVLRLTLTPLFSTTTCSTTKNYPQPPSSFFSS